ncbi:hypothetical protein CPB97_009751 [Podila verticillata]|nr:hypothetical protein CPB97_009751 [Podila verticillata]
MATPLGRVAARTLFSSSLRTTRYTTSPIRTLLASKPRPHNYSSLRRTPRSVSSSSRGGRIIARTTPSRASPLGAVASSHIDPATPSPTESDVVQGIDVAGTPVVVPEDPFGVLQPYDTAAKVLSQPALIMTRQIEMMNVLVGFEQANKYAIVDPTGSPIGYIAEEDTTFVKTMSRQMLKTHRPFKASVLDLEGNEILKIHRPFAFINSRIMISTPDDRLIGEVQQEWHLVRRRYNLFTVEQPDLSEYESDIVDTTTIAIAKESAKGDASSLNRVQFAHIDGGFLALDFDMQDEQGQKMASVNRNFVGFARELFTDSGQYALRFDAAVIQDLQQQQGLGVTPTTPNNEKELQQAQEIQANKDEKALAQLVDRGGLTLDQRAIMLACAVSIDFDYFSRHSGNGGIMPFPMMMGGGGSAPVPSSGSDNPVGTVIGAGAGAGAGQVLGGAGAGAGQVGGVGGIGEAPLPPAGQTMDWGDELPGGEPKNDWGEDVWAEDSSAAQDSGDSWFGGKSGGDGGGEGGGFDWGDLL